MKMTQRQIETYAREFLRNQYNLEMTVPFLVNPRLITTLGKFVHRIDRRDSSNRIPLKLEISKRFLIDGNLEDIKSTIRHECTHYALYMMGKPHKDGHPVFEGELRKHNTGSTRTTRLDVVRNMNVYKCNCKTHTFARALKNDGRYHSCKRCNSRLTYLGKKKMAN